MRESHLIWAFKFENLGNKSGPIFLSPVNIFKVGIMSVVPTKELNPLLAAYLSRLATNPILTKSVTSSTLSFVSEIIAGHWAKCPPPPLAAKDRTGIPPVDFLKQNHKAVKLALYGFFVSAPLSHFLLGLLQRAFQGKTSARAKVAQIVSSNLLLSPIQQTVYISAMAIIGGARSYQDVYRAWRASFVPVMRLTWVVSTLSMATAQKLLAPELWVPFFTLVGTVVGTTINAQGKRRAIAAAKERAKQEAKASDKEAADL